jgi:hypothetical protein
MRTLYIILCSIGWAWLGVLFGLLWMQRRRTDPDGVEGRVSKEND